MAKQILWRGGGSCYCTNCGGVSITFLANGQARCNNCGLVAPTTRVGQFTGLRRAIGILGFGFLAVCWVETLFAFLVSGGSLKTVAEMWLGSGLIAFLVGGGIVASGSGPRVGSGGVSLRDEQRRRIENTRASGPWALLALFGLAQIFVAVLLGL